MKTTPSSFFSLSATLAAGLSAVFGLSACGGGGSDSSTITPPTITTTIGACSVTLAKYQQVTGGMSSFQVNTIFGCTGVPVAGGANGVTGYTWKDSNTGNIAGAAFSSIYPVNGHTGLYFKNAFISNVLYESSY